MVLAHTYDFPLVYVPLAPSGLHQAPGYTETPTDAGTVTDGKVAVGEVADGDVAAGTVTDGEVAAGEVAVGAVAAGDVSIVPISGASDHGAITSPTHDALSRFLIRPHSL